MRCRELVEKVRRLVKSLPLLCNVAVPQLENALCVVECILERYGCLSNNELGREVVLDLALRLYALFEVGLVPRDVLDMSTLSECCERCGVEFYEYGEVAILYV